MTVNRKLLLMALGLAVVAGCNPKSETSGVTAQKGPDAPVTATTEPGKSAQPSAVDPAPGDPVKPPGNTTKPAPGSDPDKEPTAPKTKLRGPNDPLPRGQSEIKPGALPAHPAVEVDRTWTKIGMKPMDLAKMVEKRLESLQGVEGGVSAVIDIPSGRGDTTGVLQIVNPKMLRARYTTYEGSGLGTRWVIVNGGKAACSPLQNDNNWDVTPVAKSPAFAIPPEGIVWAWKSEFQRLVYGAVVGTKPFSKLVAAWSNPKSGYRVETQERIVTVRGQKYRSLRIQAVKGGPTAEPDTTSLVFDANLYLPTTIAVNARDKRGNYKITWSCRWDNNKAFPKKDFVMPKTKA